MAPAAHSRTSRTSTKPYARSPTPAARRLDGTLVGRLNALMAEDRALPRFDINVTERDRPKIAFCYTAEELFYMQPAGQPNFDACVDCNLPVAFCGWQGYHLDKVTGHLVASGHRCKACIQYSLMNPLWDGQEQSTEGPPCTCPSGSMACQEVPTGCALHIVPAMTLAPPGVKRIVRPHRRHEGWVLLWEREQRRQQEYRDAVADLDTTPEECEAAERRLEEARDLLYTYPQTPLANFKWPPPTPPRVVIRPPSRPYQPPPRQFRPKIPPGHLYDYRGADRRRTAEQVADPVAEAFYSYNK
ncbi:hypothetical protein B0H19DRAFT_1080153 [Mycena capillaripes]|nr:hypothetical protein B0H19DRAFT_1080153 [Mycena capillaripes]